MMASPHCQTLKTGKTPGICDFTAFQNVDLFSKKGHLLVEGCLMLRSATVPRKDAEVGLPSTALRINDDNPLALLHHCHFPV